MWRHPWLLQPGRIDKTVQFRQLWTNRKPWLTLSGNVEKSILALNTHCLIVPDPNSSLAPLGWGVKGMVPVSSRDKLYNRLGEWPLCPTHPTYSQFVGSPMKQPHRFIEQLKEKGIIRAPIKWGEEKFSQYTLKPTRSFQMLAGISPLPWLGA